MTIYDRVENMLGILVTYIYLKNRLNLNYFNVHVTNNIVNDYLRVFPVLRTSCGTSYLVPFVLIEIIMIFQILFAKGKKINTYFAM